MRRVFNPDGKTTGLTLFIAYISYNHLCIECQIYLVLLCFMSDLYTGANDQLLSGEDAVNRYYGYCLSGTDMSFLVSHDEDHTLLRCPTLTFHNI